MNDRRWYTADTLTADLTNHHHHLALFVRQEVSWRQVLSRWGPIP